MSGRLPTLREHTGNPALDRMQQATEQAQRMLNAAPIAAGKLTDTYTFTAGETKSIPHKLGRKPTGLLVAYALTGDATWRFASEPTELTCDVRMANAGTYRFLVW